MPPPVLLLPETPWLAAVKAGGAPTAEAGPADRKLSSDNRVTLAVKTPSHDGTAVVPSVMSTHTLKGGRERGEKLDQRRGTIMRRGTRTLWSVAAVTSGSTTKSRFEGQCESAGWNPHGDSHDAAGPAVPVALYTRPDLRSAEGWPETLAGTVNVVAWRRPGSPETDDCNGGVTVS